MPSLAEIKLQWGSLPFDSINAESLGLLLAKPTETICPVNRISGAIGKCKTKKRSAVADGLNTQSGFRPSCKLRVGENKLATGHASGQYTSTATSVCSTSGCETGKEISDPDYGKLKSHGATISECMQLAREQGFKYFNFQAVADTNLNKPQGQCYGVDKDRCLCTKRAESQQETAAVRTTAATVTRANALATSTAAAAATAAAVRKPTPLNAWVKRSATCPHARQPGRFRSTESHRTAGLCMASCNRKNNCNGISYRRGGACWFFSGRCNAGAVEGNPRSAPREPTTYWSAYDRQSSEVIRQEQVAEVARVANVARIVELARVAKVAKVAAVAAAARATEVARVAKVAAAARAIFSGGTRGYEIRFDAVNRPHGGGAPLLPFAYSRKSVSFYTTPPLGKLFLLCIPDTCDALQVTKAGAIKISVKTMKPGSYGVTKDPHTTTKLGEVAVENLEASGFKYYGVTKGRGYMKCQEGNNALYNTILDRMTLEKCTDLCVNDCAFIEWVPAARKCRIIRHCGKIVRDSGSFNRLQYTLLFRNVLTGFNPQEDPVLSARGASREYKIAAAIATGVNSVAAQSLNAISYAKHKLQGLSCKNGMSCSTQRVPCFVPILGGTVKPKVQDLLPAKIRRVEYKMKKNVRCLRSFDENGFMSKIGLGSVNPRSLLNSVLPSVGAIAGAAQARKQTIEAVRSIFEGSEKDSIKDKDEQPPNFAPLPGTAKVLRPNLAACAAECDRRDSCTHFTYYEGMETNHNEWMIGNEKLLAKKKEHHRALQAHKKNFYDSESYLTKALDFMKPDEPICKQSFCIPLVGCKETWGMYNNVCGRKKKSESQMCPATKMYGMTKKSAHSSSLNVVGKSADGYSMKNRDMAFNKNDVWGYGNNRILHDGRVNSEGLIKVSRLPGKLFGKVAILAMMRAIAPDLTILPWELNNVKLPGVENLQCFAKPKRDYQLQCCKNCVYPGARGEASTTSFGGIRNPIKSKRKKRTKKPDSTDERPDCENFVFKACERSQKHIEKIREEIVELQPEEGSCYLLHGGPESSGDGKPGSLKSIMSTLSSGCGIIVPDRFGGQTFKKIIGDRQKVITSNATCQGKGASKCSVRYDFRAVKLSTNERVFATIKIVPVNVVPSPWSIQNNVNAVNAVRDANEKIPCTSHGRHVYSPNFDGQKSYDSNNECLVTATTSGLVKVHHFDISPKRSETVAVQHRQLCVSGTACSSGGTRASGTRSKTLGECAAAARTASVAYFSSTARTATGRGECFLENTCSCSGSGRALLEVQTQEKNMMTEKKVTDKDTTQLEVQTQKIDTTEQFVAVNDIAETILTEEEEKIKQQEQDKTDSGISADMRLGNIVIDKSKANSFLEQKVGGYYKCSWGQTVCGKKRVCIAWGNWREEGEEVWEEENNLNGEETREGIVYYKDAKCNTGFYASSSNGYPCGQCQRGKYQNQITRSRSCKNCPSGQYTSSTCQTSCTTCPAGRVAGAGASGCSACPHGKYQRHRGQATCATCPSGQYQPHTGQTSCTYCHVGQYQPGAGASSCSACPIAKYQVHRGQTQCTTCAAGRYHTSTGRSSANSCSQIVEPPVPTDAAETLYNPTGRWRGFSATPRSNPKNNDGNAGSCGSTFLEHLPVSATQGKTVSVPADNIIKCTNPTLQKDYIQECPYKLLSLHPSTDVLLQAEGASTEECKDKAHARGLTFFSHISLNLNARGGTSATTGRPGACIGHTNPGNGNTHPNIQCAVPAMWLKRSQSCSHSTQSPTGDTSVWPSASQCRHHCTRHATCQAVSYRKSDGYCMMFSNICNAGNPMLPTEPSKEWTNYDIATSTLTKQREHGYVGYKIVTPSITSRCSTSGRTTTVIEHEGATNVGGANAHVVTKTPKFSAVLSKIQFIGEPMCDGECEGGDERLLAARGTSRKECIDLAGKAGFAFVSHYPVYLKTGTAGKWEGRCYGEVNCNICIESELSKFRGYRIQNSFTSTTANQLGFDESKIVLTSTDDTRPDSNGREYFLTAQKPSSNVAQASRPGQKFCGKMDNPDIEAIDKCDGDCGGGTETILGKSGSVEECMLAAHAKGYTYFTFMAMTDSNINRRGQCYGEAACTKCNANPNHHTKWQGYKIQKKGYERFCKTKCVSGGNTRVNRLLATIFGNSQQVAQPAKSLEECNRLADLNGVPFFSYHKSLKPDGKNRNCAMQIECPCTNKPTTDDLKWEGYRAGKLTQKQHDIQGGFLIKAGDMLRFKSGDTVKWHNQCPSGQMCGGGKLSFFSFFYFV